MMSESNNKKIDHVEPVRKNPPVLPLGIRFGIASEICVMDFLDQHSDGTGKYCFYSIALTKNHAQQIINNLSKFLEG